MLLAVPWWAAKLRTMRRSQEQVDGCGSRCSASCASVLHTPFVCLTYSDCKQFCARNCIYQHATCRTALGRSPHQVCTCPQTRSTTAQSLPMKDVIKANEANSILTKLYCLQVPCVVLFHMATVYLNNI